MLFSVIGLVPAGGIAPEDDRVAISRSDFREKLRGRTFKHWGDLKESLGAEAQLDPNVGGEERLVSGLSIAVVIILNVLVWAVAAYIAKLLGKSRPRLAAWIIFSIIAVYGFCVHAYCQHAYADPHQRLVTNFLFGAVPLAVSFASYVLALLVLDVVRSTTSKDGFDAKLLDRLNPWQERFDGRLIFFIAVLPGLAMSIHLGNTVSTGFRAAATHFDVLSLCLFIDVGRCVGHLAYLVAPKWSIGKSPDSISSRPGLCYVFHVLSLAWYFVLARYQPGQNGFTSVDQTKIRTLACLTSLVFFPLSIYLACANNNEFFGLFEEQHKHLRALVLIICVLVISLFMIVVSIVFDTIEPNVMGIGAMLWVVFYGAWTFSDGSLLAFILVLIPLAAVVFGFVSLLSHHADMFRNSMLAALRWSP